VKRLLIIADHSFVVEAIRLALRQTAGFQVAGFVDGRVCVRSALAELQPDVVLIDDMQGSPLVLDRLKEIAQDAPQAQALVLALDMREDWLAEAFEAGASAVISKTVHPVALGTLVRETTAGTVVHSFTARSRATRERLADCPLTDREREILRLVAAGHTNGDIARQLWVTEPTVKFHLSNTYRKLGVSNRTEATRYAYAYDLVDDGPPRRIAA
jgi:DNA-binding NarL/FixJ family response regulator